MDRWNSAGFINGLPPTVFTQIEVTRLLFASIPFSFCCSTRGTDFSACFNLAPLPESSYDELTTDSDIQAAVRRTSDSPAGRSLSSEFKLQAASVNAQAEA